MGIRYFSVDLLVDRNGPGPFTGREGGVAGAEVNSTSFLTSTTRGTVLHRTGDNGPLTVRGLFIDCRELFYCT